MKTSSRLWWSHTVMVWTRPVWNECEQTVQSDHMNVEPELDLQSTSLQGTGGWTDALLLCWEHKHKRRELYRDSNKRPVSSEWFGSVGLGRAHILMRFLSLKPGKVPKPLTPTVPLFGTLLIGCKTYSVPPGSCDVAIIRRPEGNFPFVWKMPSFFSSLLGLLAGHTVMVLSRHAIM